MVRHADKGAGYKHLTYSTRPHSEYRTTIHVAVQMLQPKLEGQDTENWQHVADIFNHLFADDLKTQNVRLQDAKHWRDQYVHRYANSRPAEWKTICRPDEEQSKEEMARRQGYRRRIQQAATDLGIQLPTTATTGAQTGTVQSVKRKASPELERRTAFDDAGVAAPKVKARKPTNRAALAGSAAPEEEDEMEGKKVLRKGKGWTEYEEEDDDGREETYEERFKRNLPDQSLRRQTVGHPVPSYTKNASATSMLDPSFDNGYGGQSTAGDEALAQSLQEEESRGRRHKKDAGRIDYESIASSEDENDRPEMRAVDQEPKVTRLKRKPAGITFAQSKKDEAKRRKTVNQLAADDEPKNLRAKKPIEARKKLPPSSPSVSSLSASPPPNNSTSSGPPPLPMIHGGSTKVFWIDGIPHAHSAVTEGERAPAILRPSSLLAKRGGKVMRGVLDEKEQDVMVCPADECSWCDPKIGNSTVPSTARKSLNRPLVHSCCAKRDEETGVAKFVQDEGVKFEWHGRFPNHVNSGKVEFNDGVLRDVFVCVEKMCETCQEIKEEGKMEE